MSAEITKIAVFKGKNIRRILLNNEWWFSITDIVEILTGTERPRKYWNDLKKKLTQEGYVEVSEKIGQLKLKAPDGKEYLTDCANTEVVFRIIQSIPSPKAEPFKRWLARIGKERLDEIENPELGMQRTAEPWLEEQEKISNNKPEQRLYPMKTSCENLRDHMTDMELIIAMLGEATTTRITQNRNSQDTPALQKDAKDGGAVAGRTRKDIEQQTGTKVVSNENFLRGKTRKLLK